MPQADIISFLVKALNRIPLTITTRQPLGAAPTQVTPWILDHGKPFMVA
jgi:hypothetical protein